MSIEAVAWALNAPLKGTQKVLLIGLANHATAEFEHARPAISTLARYANCHERNVQKALRDLEADGWIECTGTHPLHNRKDRAVNVYRLLPARGGDFATPHVDGVAFESERGGAGVSDGVALAPPEPSIEPSIEPSNPKSVRATPVDEVWAHYQATRPHGNRCKLGPDERKVIKAALAVADVAECKAAITGLFRSDYHVGGGYVHIKYALRGGGHGPSPRATIDRLTANGHANGNGRPVGILERQVWPDGRTWNELTANEQAVAKDSMAMGVEPWRAPEPAAAAVTGNGRGRVFTAENFADPD